MKSFLGLILFFNINPILINELYKPHLTSMSTSLVTVNQHLSGPSVDKNRQNKKSSPFPKFKN